MKIEKFLKNQRGFTLAETIAALIIMGMIGVHVIQKKQAESKSSVVDNAGVSAIAVQNAARAYRLETGSWPTNTNQLVSKGLLTTAQATSPFGTAYTFATSGNQLVISNATADNTYARRLSGILPSGTNSGKNYSFRVTPPGNEATLAAVYKADGTTPLSGNMNANGYSINNVSTLNATNVNSTNVKADNLTAGQAKITGLLEAGSIKSTGNIRGNTLTADGTITAGGNISTGQSISAGGNITANGILKGNGLNVNGDSYVYGNSYAKNIYADNLQLTQQLTTGGHVSVGGDLSVYGTSHTQNVRANGYVLATKEMYAQRFYDHDDTNKYIDPNGESWINGLTIDGELKLLTRRVIGQSCNTTQLAFDHSETLITCRNGIWEAVSASNIKTKHFADAADADLGKVLIKTGRTFAYAKTMVSRQLNEPFPANYRLSCTTTVIYFDWVEVIEPITCQCDVNACSFMNASKHDLPFEYQVIGIQY